MTNSVAPCIPHMPGMVRGGHVGRNVTTICRVLWRALRVSFVWGEATGQSCVVAVSTARRGALLPLVVVVVVVFGVLSTKQ